MIKNERPPPEPMFSPTGIPYYRTWRAAIRCWLQDPKKRPSMKSVAQILRLPITPPPRLNAAVQVRSENTSKPVPNVMENPAQGSGEELEEEPGSEKETEDNDEGEESEEITYCYCGGDSYGLMVDCCDERCDREWVCATSMIHRWLKCSSQSFSVPLALPRNAFDAPAAVVLPEVRIDSYDCMRFSGQYEQYDLHFIVSLLCVVHSHVDMKGCG